MSENNTTSQPGTIDELKPDNKNFNKHTEYGMALLEKSLRQNGAGRSILVDKDDNIIAGNGIVEAAQNAGITKTRVVEVTGDELVVVKRTDLALDSKQGREMALADNATAAVDLAWDEDTLTEVAAEYDFAPEDWGVVLDADFDQPTNNEINVDDFDDKIEMKLHFTIEEHAFVQQKLAELGETKEQAILKLLGYEDEQEPTEE